MYIISKIYSLQNHKNDIETKIIMSYVFIFQKPLMLHGHERSITQIKYNREGDLLFSCAKDPQPNVWYGLNGERLGTFRGHTGAVWCLDVNCIL